MVVNVRNSEELVMCFQNLKPGTEIRIQEGEYYVSESLNIDCDDVKITGQGKGTIINGTKKIDFEGLERVGNAVKIDLNQFGINKVHFAGGPYKDYWKDYDIPKPHLLDQGPALQLLYNGREMHHARYPEKGFLQIKKSLGETGIYFQKQERNGSEEGIFVPSDTSVFENDHIENLCLIGYWNADWAMQRHTVTAYDCKTGAVTVNTPWHLYGYRDGRNYTSDVGADFYILNTRMGLNEPGDWYIEVEENVVYLLPYEGQSHVEVSVCGDLITADHQKNLRIENMTLCGAKKCAVHMEHCENVVVKNVEACHLGAWGILTDWCQNARVEGCHVHETAGGGISSSGGDRNILESSHNVVIRNYVHNIALWHKTYMPAIEIDGVGVTVRENQLYDVPNSAIMYHGNNHIIEKNIIKRACNESNDAGAIYAGRDCTCQGTIIRYNYLGELYGHERNGCIGVYFDDGMCTAKVYGNIFYDIPYVAILLGGGRDFDIFSNYFFKCQITVMFDDRVNRWTNLYDKITNHLSDVPYQSEIWKQTYPNLYTMQDDEPKLPKYNKFRNNTVIGGKGLLLSKSDIEQYLEHSGNSYEEMEDVPLVWHLQNWTRIFED